MFGYELSVTRMAVADELAGAAELATGSANEAVPAVIVRGYEYRASNKGAKILIRPLRSNLFV